MPELIPTEIMQRIESLKTDLGKNRDTLRDYIDELEAIYSTADDAYQTLESIIEEAKHAAEVLSQYL